MNKTDYATEMGLGDPNYLYRRRMEEMALLRTACLRTLMDMAMVLLPDEYLNGPESGCSPDLYPIYSHYYHLLGLFLRTDWHGQPISDGERVRNQFLTGHHMVGRIVSNPHHPWRDIPNQEEENVRGQRAYRQARQEFPASDIQLDLLREMFMTLGCTGSWRHAAMELIEPDPVFYQRVFSTTAGLFLTGRMPEALAVTSKVCEPFLTAIIPSDEGAIYRHLKYRTVTGGIPVLDRRFLMTDDWFYVIDL